MKNRALRWLYWKTGLVSAAVAMITALQVDFDWGSRFAIAAFFGLLNWFALGAILVGLTEKNIVSPLIWLSIKIALLGTLVFAVLPVTGLQATSFLCGFNMFLIVALMDCIGQIIVDSRKQNPDGRQMPKDIRSFFMGTATDA
ncbi:hypothetical protein KQI84_07270 [bacterium]|nr:hypothetical protein [bacterium]